MKTTSLLRQYYLLLLCICLIPVTLNRVRPSLRSVIWSDAEGYYVYLPTVFSIKDLHATPRGTTYSPENEKGETVIKYTCGVAYFQLPFYLIAKYYFEKWGDAANLTMEKSNIFGPVFSWAVVAAGFCAGFIGLFSLQNALRRRGFQEPVTALTLLAIFGGTNLFHYTTNSMGMSHVYSFCLFSIVIALLPRVYERPGLLNTTMLGVLIGWIVLIRPTNAALLIFIVLYEVYSGKDLMNRIRFFSSKIPYILAAALAGLLVVFPQLYYWHEMTGRWLTFSYRSNEAFIYWKHPKIADVFLNPQNGLLLYSPLILLAFIGIFQTWKSRKLHNPAIFITLLVASYTFASWWCWWFGGAFGHRSFIEYYALLAFPMAGMIEKMLNIRQKGVKYAAIGLLLFLIFYSVKMSYLYTTLPGAWDGPEWDWKMDKLMAVWQHLW